MNDVEREDDAFASLIAACDDALAAGKEPACPADTPAEMHDRLQRGLAGMRLLRRMLARQGAQDGAPPDPLEQPLPRLGRFELLHELGRGGFGIVYLARDPTLARQVALKVPRPECLTHPSLRQRFLHEAQAAAGLDHPNIVQVYEAGEVGPVCYLAAAYCPGTNLAGWLRERTDPVPPREAAALLATLADAIHYAHSRGVVHRDLKPANVLLQSAGSTSKDGDLRSAIPKITDFGIAKVLTAQTMDTTTGVALGTPAYMAPEQAQANRGAVGPAADVYALGAILYEMLTGRPPFRGTTALETLDLVRSAEPVAPRLLQSKLPRDLETISLKCLEKKPGRRYANAAELSADLGRFLRGESIHARPSGWSERAWKWAKRRPVVAVSAAISGVALLSLILVWISFTIDLGKARAQADRDARDAREQRSRAESSRDQALATVDRFLTRLGDDQLASVPGMDVVRRDLLQDAVEFQQALLRELNDEDPAVRRQVGLGLQRLARLHFWLRQRAEQEQDYRQALEIQQQLSAEFPNDDRYRRDLGKTLHHLAILTRRAKSQAETEEAFRRVFELREDLARRHPEEPEHLADLAQTLISYGLLFRPTDLQRAQAIYQRALTIQEGLIRDHPEVIEYLGGAANTQGKLAELAYVNQDLREAEAGFLRARDLYARLEQAKGKGSSTVGDLAGTYSNLAGIYSLSNRHQEALAAYEKASSLRQRQVADHPAVPLFAWSLGTAYLDTGTLFLNQQMYNRARVPLSAALEVLKSLTERYPNELDYRRSLAAVYGSLCLVERDADHWDIALAHNLTAVALLEPLLREQPKSVPFMETMATACVNLASDLQVQGKIPEARGAIDRAIRLAEDIRKRFPKHAKARELLEMAYRSRGDLHAWLGQFDPAMKDWEQAATLEARGEASARQAPLTVEAFRQVTKGDHRGANASIKALLNDFSSRVDPNLTFRFAWIYTLAAAAAQRDAALKDNDRSSLVESYLRQAVESLERAQRTGYFKVNVRRRLLQIDPILAPLRMRPDFPETLKKVAK